MVFYLVSFYLLEHRTVDKLHLISSPLDKYIPFCEFFIVPYYLWFIYMTAILIYFIFFSASVTEYHQLAFSLGIGMTVFLFLSLIYPNGLNLRPAEFPRQNLFTFWVHYLYGADTSTNVFPSIHVYNSVAALIAIRRCKALKNRRVIQNGAFILTVLIVLSTVFLKQHSVSDVIAAFVMNFILYAVIYRPGWLFVNTEPKETAGRCL